MRRTWIIADDLTGAADSGAPFAGSNEQVILDLDPDAQANPTASVQVIDTDTREATPTVIAPRMATVARKIGPDDLVVKKIDSLLRGNITQELRILRNSMPTRLLIVAPAVPALGRTTINGHVRAGNPQAVPTDPRIAHHIPAHHFHRVSPSDVPHTIQRAHSEDALICDAESDEDLDAVVRAVLKAGLPVLWVGAAGLAAALARGLNPPPNHQRMTTPPTATRILTVIGSHSQMALEQAKALAKAGHPAIELTAGRHEELPKGTRVISLTGDVNPDRHEHTARTLGETCREAVREADVLLLAGGATARAVLTAAGIPALHLIGELEPGIVLSRPHGTGRPMHVITKSGSFGDEQSLVRLVAAITKGRP